MKKKALSIFSLMLTLLLCFSMIACNSGGSDYADADKGGAPGSDGGEGQIAVTGAVNRKIVYTVDLEIEAENVGSVYKTLTEKASALGGYIESDRQYYEDGKIDSCYVTYRVPTEKLNEFLSVAESSGRLTDKYVYTDDITTQYVSAQARKQSLVDRKTQLEALLTENITVSEKLSLIEQISTVNAQILQIDLMLAGYDSDVDFSTVTVEISDGGIGGAALALLFVIVSVIAVGGALAVIVVVVSSKKKKAVNF